MLSQERQPECDSENIGAYNITGVEKAAEYNETTKPKISVTFELDRSGLLVVTKAEAKTESWTEEQVVKKKNDTEAANETSAEELERVLCFLYYGECTLRHEGLAMLASLLGCKEERPELFEQLLCTIILRHHAKKKLQLK